MSTPDSESSLRFRGRSPTELAFGTSGLRGLVTDITDLEAYVNTRGFLRYVRERELAQAGSNVAVGGDLRPSTDSPERSILRAVLKAITDEGFVPRWCGRLPTPALSYYGFEQRWPAVMVTGSHIPFDRNGIKFNLPAGEVLKSDEAPILAAVRAARVTAYGEPSASSPFDDAGMFRARSALELSEEPAAREQYVQRLLGFFPERPLDGLRLVLYEHSAVGRELVGQVLEMLGASVYRRGRTEGFVAIDTEAIDAQRLLECQRLADGARAEHGEIDAIVSTDGDSDRPLLLGIGADGQVEFFGGDVVGMVVAAALGAEAVAVPVSATDAIEQYFEPRGVSVVRTRIGSPFVIAAMRELKAERVVGWEANGGFLVGSTIHRQGRELRPLPTRDALLPLVTVLAEARRRRVPLRVLFAELPRRFGNAGLIDVAEGARQLLERAYTPREPKLVEARFGSAGTECQGVSAARAAELAPLLQEITTNLSRHFTRELGFGAVTKLNFLDGIRVTFENGDIAHVRASGNAPQLRMYSVAGSAERAQRVVDMALAPDGLLTRLLAAAKARADGG
jgi:phosphomannomutase